MSMVTQHRFVRFLYLPLLKDVTRYRTACCLHCYNCAVCAALGLGVLFTISLILIAPKSFNFSTIPVV